MFFVYSALIINVTNIVSANETGNDKLQFSGFATLGAVYSDSDIYGFRGNIGSDDGAFAGQVNLKQLSLLGLQANWSIFSNVDAVYQAVIRDLPEASFDRYTTLAFLRYQLNTNWSMRVGRTAPDIFLMTEYRDVNFAYVWGGAPNEVYGIIPYRSLDGVDITYTQRGLGGVFKSKLYTGRSEAEIASSAIVEKIKIKDVVGLSLSFDHFDWIVQGRYSQAVIGNEPKSNALVVDAISQVPDFLWQDSQVFAETLLVDGDKVNYGSVSGQYQWENWLTTVELSHINFNSDKTPKVNGGYGALSYQMDAHQFYTIYAFAKADSYVFDEPGVNQEVLADLINATTGIVNFYAANQQTTSLGWRWDITSNIASSLQWNYTQLKESGGTLWLKKEVGPSPAANINTLLFSVSTVF